SARLRPHGRSRSPLPGNNSYISIEPDRVCQTAEKGMTEPGIRQRRRPEVPCAAWILRAANWASSPDRQLGLRPLPCYLVILTRLSQECRVSRDSAMPNANVPP